MATVTEQVRVVAARRPPGPRRPLLGALISPGRDPLKLFARFARGDSSRARQTGGTGLGLAIAKAIVEGHHGRIEVSSAPGDTTFAVHLTLSPVVGA